MWFCDHVSLSSCVTLTAWHITGRYTFRADSLAIADNTSLLNQAHVQYQSGTGGSTVEKPAETQTSIWLASHLVRVCNSRSEVHEFEYPMRKDPWHQVFLQDAMTSIQYILYLSLSLNKSYGVTFAFDLSFHMLFLHRYMENCIEIAIVVRVQIVSEIITMC
jgi:hypothetical protein